MSYDIQAVATKKHWKDFFDVRRTIYREDPAAVIPLRAMEKQQLDKASHPFYLHADSELFVAYEDQEPVGRIVAIHDRLHNEHYDDKVGFFGFFESRNDVALAKALLDTAQKWLEERGCDTMRGPVNPSMKSDFGVLMEGHSTAPFVMMGHTPLFYHDLLAKSGMEVCKRFFAYAFNSIEDSKDLRPRWQRLNKTVERIMKRYPSLQIRTVDSANYVETLHDINRLGNSVRAANYGFVPLTPEELDFMVSQLKRIIRFDMIHAAYWDDELVGFIVNIPDVNWCLKQTWGNADWVRMIQLPFLLKKTPRTRVIALGVHNDYLKKGIGAVLIKRLIDQHDQFEEWEFSWVAEDNIKSMGIIEATMSLNLHKVYHLYEKAIS